MCETEQNASHSPREWLCTVNQSKYPSLMRGDQMNKMLLYTVFYFFKSHLKDKFCWLLPETSKIIIEKGDISIFQF